MMINLAELAADSSAPNSGVAAVGVVEGAPGWRRAQPPPRGAQPNDNTSDNGSLCFIYTKGALDRGLNAPWFRISLGRTRCI